MFANDAKKPIALDIHEFVFHKLRLTENEVVSIQLELTKRRFYVKVREESKHKISQIKSINSGMYSFPYEDKTMTTIKVMEANGLGIRWVRVLYLPEEVENRVIQEALNACGEVLLVRDELWSNQYRYKVKNGIRNMKIELKRHIPSYIDVLGHQAVTLYEEQPRTCALCHSVEHFRSECPLRRRTSIPNPLEQVPGSYRSYAGAARGGEGPHTKDTERGEQAADRAGRPCGSR